MHGGKCLSGLFSNLSIKLDWECAKGHRWSVKPKGVMRGSWCPICAGRQRLSLEDMRSLASERGGKCLAKAYINTCTKLQWECTKGHRWWAVPSSIRAGTWCPTCGGRPSLGIEDMQALARERGGLCLSSIYVNATTKLRWRCTNGHEWEAVPGSLRNLGTWCPTCGGRERLTIEAMHNLAAERGGRCLSKTYTNNVTKLRWQCIEGHKWEAAPAGILNGSWCPTCGKGMGERVCREVFEQIFAQPFPSSYPEWLRTKRGTTLELDGYCEPLMLAFEHQGAHHYGNSPFFKEPGNFAAQQERDAFKAAQCMKHGVALVLIPEIPRLLPTKEVSKFILAECNRLGVATPPNAEQIKVSLARAYAVPDTRRTFAFLEAIASAKGGKTLSRNYRGLYEKLRWQCEKGHVWEACPADIKAGNWCPHCAGHRKTIHDMKGMARERGGECLSTRYRGMRHKLTWRCPKGHEWRASAVSVSIGHWCPTCGGSKPLTIEEMHRMAKERGGECLSTKYSNSITKLRWRCAQGHEWEAVPSSLRAGTWCPVCGVKKRVSTRTGKTAPLGIEAMDALAAKHGGKCISRIYKSSREKLSWRCDKGHEWTATYNSVKSNRTWCPRCRSRNSSVPLGNVEATSTRQ
jgi:Zn finger protein HypA/HybF involved in hydrogenase expression